MKTLSTLVLESVGKINEMSPIRPFGKLLHGDVTLGSLLDHSLEERYELLGRYQQYKVWLGKGLRNALITEQIKETHEGEHYNKLCVELYFNNSSKLNIKSKLQVEMVKADSIYKGKGLCTILYLVLAHKGYNVVSDYIQYEDAIKMWKRLSTIYPEIFTVKLYNTILKDYVKDFDNIPLKYNPGTICDEEVWSTNSNKETTLLVLSMNKE